MPVSKEEMLPPNPIEEAFTKHKITPTYLVKRLKREINARETKVIKIKGAIRQKDLPKGFTIIGTSGLLAYDKEGEQVFGDGETIIRYDPWSMGIQQKARQDAHKLRGDYPAEETKHTFPDLPTMTVVVREMMKEKNGGR